MRYHELGLKMILTASFGDNAAIDLLVITRRVFAAYGLGTQPPTLGSSIVLAYGLFTLWGCA